MDLSETLKVKAEALIFSSKLMKIANDLSLEAQTSFDGDNIQELLQNSRKQIKKFCL